MGLGVVEIPDCGFWCVGKILLRKSLLRVTFWIDAVFLKTEGFAGVERGVEGVEAPSWTGVLSPVLLPSLGCELDSVRGATSPSVFATCVLSEESAFSVSLAH